MTSAAADVILVFLRVPEPGKVKTRLAKRLGDRAACHLYRQFILAELETLANVGKPIRICFHPAGQRARLEGWLGPGYACWPQSGGTLGERMAAAFQRAFHAGAERAVLIGTDVPDLPDRILREAFHAFQRYPAVIGPATDGGYYLIGFTRQGVVPEIFGHLPWGSETVFPETLRIFEKSGTPVHLLPAWRDIDEYEDLLAFARRNESACGSQGGIARLVETVREAITGALEERLKP
jgi:rSAM/selenodomain-associated transferase 1